jgi:prepilin-type N-terminal cleavage/methylation domain-containing protein
MQSSIFHPITTLKQQAKQYSPHQHVSNKGFTLIELSIVLVIIGLIISSVMVGQEVIRAAELRATTTQYQQFQTGVNTFISKYGAIPGDIKGSDYGLTAATAAYQDGTAGAGDRNGLLTEAGNAATFALPTGELSTFWSHLTTTGRELIPGGYDGNGGTSFGLDIPEAKIGGVGWGVYGENSRNYFVAGIVGGATAAEAYATQVAFIPVNAHNIDSKIDDGVPTTGDVTSGGAGALGTGASTAGAASLLVCNNTGSTPDSYQFSATEALCTLKFRMGTF